MRVSGLRGCGAALLLLVLFLTGRFLYFCFLRGLGQRDRLPGPCNCNFRVFAKTHKVPEIQAFGFLTGIFELFEVLFGSRCIALSTSQFEGNL